MSKLSKLISLAVLTVIIFSFALNAYALEPKLGVSASYRNSKYYSNLINVDTSSGNQRQIFFDIAKSQIGYLESDSANNLSGETPGSNNYTEYGGAFGANKRINVLDRAWCAYFVSWCARQAGIDAMKSSGYAGPFSETTYKWADLVQGSYQPQAGDIVTFKWSNKPKDIYSHVGIVASCTRNSNGTYKLITIEGNTDNSVVEKTRTINSDGTITGTKHIVVNFGIPNFSGSNTGASGIKPSDTVVGIAAKPEVKVDGNSVTVYLNYGGSATSLDIYLVQAPWGWEDIKYDVSVTPKGKNYTFGYVADGEYCAFVVARPNADSVQSEWTSFLVPNSTDLQSYTVTYLVNGGSGDYALEEYKQGEQVSISNVKPTRAGYTFVQWWDGTNTHNPGDTFTMPDKDIDLTAEWREVPEQSTEPKPTIYINGENYPDRLNVGSNFGIRGVVSTDYGIITEVWGAILDSNGNPVQQATYYPNENNHNLRYSINDDLIFGRLPNGNYTYKVTAKAVNGSQSDGKTLIESNFIVGDDGSSEILPPNITISEQTIPGALRLGKNFGIRGIVKTDYGTITRVYGVIYDSNGEVVQNCAYYTNEQSHNLRYSINNDLIFNYLSTGTYIYRVEVTATNGDKVSQSTVIDCTFTVS